MGERTGKTFDYWEVLRKELFQEKKQETYLQFASIFITGFVLVWFFSFERFYISS